MNAIQKLKKTKPRAWAIVVFSVFIFATLIVFPFAFVWNFLDNFFCLMFRSIRYFFHDLYWDCKHDTNDAIYCIKFAWRDWFSIVKTGKGLYDEDKNRDAKTNE